MTGAVGRASEREIVVATYNVHRCIGADGREDRSRIARVIEEIDADLIGLQEVMCATDTAAEVAHDQLHEIAQQLGYAAIPGPTRTHSGRVCGNALLSRWTVSTIHRLEIGIAGREPRAVLESIVREGAHAVRVLVTHFGLLGRERRLQAEMLLHMIAERPFTPTVVLGDFNEWMPRGRSLRRLDDALGASVALRTFPARLPALALDRVWVHPHTALKRILVHKSRGARGASDHLPVRAVVGVAACA